MLAGKDDVLTWLMENLFEEEAVSDFAPTGGAIWLIKAHVPEAKKERVEASIQQVVTTLTTMTPTARRGPT